uniref:Rab-GAP TBC domain-containing protein n=1 Tax=Lates calcarifer TaxID=8187 RepID=A0A4W6DRX7_LATCA
ILRANGFLNEELLVFGMSDLVAPLLTEIQDESDTFWCFVGLMENTIFISSPRDEDMERQLVGCLCVCLLILANVGLTALQLLFCHRWILLCFKREFPDTEALRMVGGLLGTLPGQGKVCTAPLHTPVFEKTNKKLCIYECMWAFGSVRFHYNTKF